MNGALFHSILLGPAALSPHVAACLVAATESVPDLRLTLGVLSSSFNNDVEESFRSRFQDSYLEFHSIDVGQAPQRAEALQIVRTELAPLIKTVPDASWQSIVRRFGKTEQATEYLRSLSPEPWMPEIGVRGKDPLLVKWVEDLMPRLLRGLVPLSVWADKEMKEWRNAVSRSGLLAASRIQCKVSVLPPDSEIGLKVQSRSLHNEIPVISIAHRKDCPLPASLVALAIVVSANNLRKSPVRFKVDELLHPERFTRFRRLRKFFAPAMTGRLDIPGLQTAAAIQRVLLSKTEEGEIRRALQALEVPEPIQQKLIDKLETLNLRLLMNLYSPRRGGPYTTKTSVRRADVFFPVGDRRRNKTLTIHIRLHKSFVASASVEELWKIIAKSYADWADVGRPAPHEVRDDDKSVGTAPVENVNPIVPHSKIPPAVTQEYVEIWQWLLAVRNKEMWRDYPGLTEIMPLLNSGDLLAIRSFKFPLEKLSWRERSEVKWSAGIHLQRPIAPRLTWKARFRGKMERFVAMSPFEALEVVACVINNGECSGEVKSQTYFVALENVSFKDGHTANVWTWLGLFRRYELLLASPQTSTRFQLLGEKTREFGKEMAWALRKHHLSETAMVNKSLAQHSVWISNYPKVEYMDADTKGRLHKVQRHATQVSILSLKHAKLIHFDGRPAFDQNTWQQIVRVVLRAQEGYTWFRPSRSGPGTTNRPEILIREGHESWYRLNSIYVEAPLARRSQYQAALRLMRELAREAKAPLPTPRSTAEELKSTYRALAKVYHPDMQEGDDTTGKTFQDLQAAYNFLKEFHR